MAKTKKRSAKGRKERKKVSSSRRQKEHKTGFQSTCLNVPDGMSLFKLKSEGIKRVEIVPYTVGEGNPYADPGDSYSERTFYVHKNIGANDNAYVCPNKTTQGKQKCPICEHRAELTRDPNADEDLIKQLSPKERQLWVVHDLSDREKGNQLWDVSFHLFGKQLDREINNADEDEDFHLYADPEEGYTLKLGVEEKAIGRTTFYAVESVGFKPRKSPLDEELLDAAPCLDDLLIILDYKKLKALFLETDEDDEDEEDDEEPRRKKKKRKKRKKKDETEDDIPF